MSFFCIRIGCLSLSYTVHFVTHKYTIFMYFLLKVSPLMRRRPKLGIGIILSLGDNEEISRLKLLININIYNNTYDPFTA